MIIIIDYVNSNNTNNNNDNSSPPGRPVELRGPQRGGRSAAGLVAQPQGGHDLLRIDMCVYVYIYICIERERDRERER